MTWCKNIFHQPFLKANDSPKVSSFSMFDNSFSIVHLCFQPSIAAFQSSANTFQFFNWIFGLGKEITGFRKENSVFGKSSQVFGKRFQSSEKALRFSESDYWTCNRFLGSYLRFKSCTFHQGICPLQFAIFILPYRTLPFAFYYLHFLFPIAMLPSESYRVAWS